MSGSCRIAQRYRMNHFLVAEQNCETKTLSESSQARPTSRRVPDRGSINYFGGDSPIEKPFMTFLDFI